MPNCLILVNIENRNSSSGLVIYSYAASYYEQKRVLEQWLRGMCVMLYGSTQILVVEQQS